MKVRLTCDRFTQTLCTISLQVHYFCNENINWYIVAYGTWLMILYSIFFALASREGCREETEEGSANIYFLKPEYYSVMYFEHIAKFDAMLPLRAGLIHAM